MPAMIAVLGYATGAAAFALLLAALAWRWRDRSSRLAWACALTSTWSAAGAYFAHHGHPSALPVTLLEIARNAGWSAFLLGLLAAARDEGTTTARLPSTQEAVYATAYTALLAASGLAHVPLPRLQSLAAAIGGNTAHAAMAVMGMLLIEQVFRGASVRERWGIKFACLGIGGMLAYDFYFYVDAMLFNRVDPGLWASRGFVAACAAPLVALSAARGAAWTPGIAVSRRLLFHSATLIGSAAYLLLVSAAGYYLRFFGGNWGTVLQTMLLFVAVLLLAAVLFSGAFRAWLRVSISKHFYHYGYDYREEWLRFTRRLAGDGPELGERAIQAIAELVESPKGVLFVGDEHRRFVAEAGWNLDTSYAPVAADAPLCRFMEQRQWVVDIDEFAQRPERYQGLALPAAVQAVPDAWLVVPLMQNATVFGFVVLARPRSRIELDWEVLDLLKIAGIQAASYLASRRTADALAVARQFETFNRMSTFVVHDLKNLVSQLALLAANAERHKDSPEFQQDMLETIEHAASKMRGLLHKLSRDAQHDCSEPVALDALLGRLVASNRACQPRPSLELDGAGPTVHADAARLERVIGHLVQNAIEATPREGRVRVRLSVRDGLARIEVSDTGRGMSEQFIRTGLFRPFASTKSSGMGIGAFEAREYVQQLGGRLEVDSSLGAGTTFHVLLPLYVEEKSDLSQAA